MRRSMHAGLSLVALAIAGCHAAPPPPRAAEPTLAEWAYPMKRPAPRDYDKVRPLRLAGSTRTYTEDQTRDLFNAVDWFPGDHPPMPRPVEHGREPNAMACAYCHLPTGAGRPENASLAGLSADYIIAQVKAFRDGARRSAAPGRLDVMNRLAPAVTDGELAKAAAYFAALPRVSHVRVVETATIPKVVVRFAVWTRAPGRATEALGRRMIEIPDDFDTFELRDPRSTYTAYVPPGSIAKGSALAAHWGPDGVLACATCHGSDYRGTAVAPPLAGRSPSTLIRALYDIQQGSRHDPGAAPMQGVVKNMTPDQMIALVAFMASRKP